MNARKDAFYSGRLKAVVFDWAGTVVDYGCFGPVAAFQEVFRARFIEPTVAEVRAHMGMDKMEHLRAISAMPRIQKLWTAIYGKKPLDVDFMEMHKDFEEFRMKTLRTHSALVPGLLTTVSTLRGMGMRIGSTTGYNSLGAKLMCEEAARHGFWPDSVVCASDVPTGRPHPWMCFRNAMELETYPMSTMVKVGDTPIDVLEGLNAGMWTVAVTTSGNEMGLTHEEVQDMDATELESRVRSIRKRMETVGAHFVIDDISGLAPVIEEINQLIAEGLRPDDYLLSSKNLPTQNDHADIPETDICSR